MDPGALQNVQRRLASALAQPGIVPLPPGIVPERLEIVAPRHAGVIRLDSWIAIRQPDRTGRHGRATTATCSDPAGAAGAAAVERIVHAAVVVVV